MPAAFAAPPTSCRRARTDRFCTFAMAGSSVSTPVVKCNCAEPDYDRWPDQRQGPGRAGPECYDKDNGSWLDSGHPGGPAPMSAVKLAITSDLYLPVTPVERLTGLARQMAAFAPDAAVLA